jgi:HSP20 family protein
MSLIRYEPWSLIRSLHDDLDRLFEQRVDRDETSASVASWTPPVDIREEDERFVLHVDVPGVKPEDIEITMENGVLTIGGNRCRGPRRTATGASSGLRAGSSAASLCLTRQTPKPSGHPATTACSSLSFRSRHA